MPQFNESTIRNNLTWLRKRGLVLKSSSNWRLTHQGKKFLSLLSQGVTVDHWIVGKAEQ
jgi:ribosomal protein S19E (S16A)